MRKGKIISRLMLCFCAVVALQACRSKADSPKPVAYLRIDMPQHAYRLCDTNVLPFAFEQSEYATLTLKRHTAHEVWADLEYPQWDGVVFLSYKRLASPDSLRGQTDTSQRLLESHYQFTSGIEEQQFADPQQQVYATTYRLGGKRVASTYQFWATDSNSHFLRGALYLNRVPNNDSLAPLLEYMQADLDHMVETLRWQRR